MKPYEIVGSDFDAEVKNSDKTVIVDFYTERCPHCYTLKPTLDKIGEEMPEVKVVKVDVERDAYLAQMYDITSVPTVIVFKDGVPYKKSTGVVPKEKLKSLLE
ncbi:MAG TPA: thioredoxin domain-containing protein [Clostridia bacterium]|nr:thioredoxin domain-containing protein [Clostridia bacterium]